MFPLHPETPPEGRTLAELFAGSGMDVTAMLAQLRQVAGDLGLPFGDRPMTYNSRNAQELGKWAEDLGKGEAYHQAVFHAYFADGINIHQPEEIAAIAGRAGLSPDAAAAVLNERRFASRVDADWQRSRSLGVRAVPTFRIGATMLTGAQPYGVLAQAVEQAGEL
jgi:predicted DsbA family dithiol-disulfide isomerase